MSRLSDGQKSLRYIGLVLALHAMGRRVLQGQTSAFDPDKMRPEIFTLLAVEEPENSLSPHYVGRIIEQLHDLAREEDAQAVLATHAPVLLRRVSPESIRYLRLNDRRQTTVRHVLIPEDEAEAHKCARFGVLSATAPEQARQAEGIMQFGVEQAHARWQSLGIDPTAGQLRFWRIAVPTDKRISVLVG